jgi:hypothetical protein
MSDPAQNATTASPELPHSASGLACARLIQLQALTRDAVATPIIDRLPKQRLVDTLLADLVQLASMLERCPPWLSPIDTFDSASDLAVLIGDCLDQARPSIAEPEFLVTVIEVVASTVPGGGKKWTLDRISAIAEAANNSTRAAGCCRLGVRGRSDCLRRGGERNRNCDRDARVGPERSSGHERRTGHPRRRQEHRRSPGGIVRGGIHRTTCPA